MIPITESQKSDFYQIDILERKMFCLLRDYFSCFWLLFNLKFSKLIYSMCISDLAEELSTFSGYLHETSCSVLYETKIWFLSI